MAGHASWWRLKAATQTGPASCTLSSAGCKWCCTYVVRGGVVRTWLGMLCLRSSGDGFLLLGLQCQGMGCGTCPMSASSPQSCLLPLLSPPMSAPCPPPPSRSPRARICAGAPQSAAHPTAGLPSPAALLAAAWRAGIRWRAARAHAASTAAAAAAATCR